MNKGTVIYSNSLEVLFEHLKINLFSTADSIFSQRLLVVPSFAMQQWVQFQLATSLSISAGIQFSFLDKAIAHLMNKLFVSPRPHFIPSSLELSMRIKNEIDAIKDSSDPIWEPLTRYIGHKDRRIIDLSIHLTKLFERYGTYAAQAALSWEKRLSNWQEALWSRIFCDWDYLQRVLLNATPRDEAIDLSIHLFSFSHISPLYYDFLCRSGRHVPLYFYQLSPCQEFWSDLSNETSTLLAPLGKLGREMARLIESSEQIEIQEGYVIFGGETQLKRLQRDLLFLHPSEAGSADESIEIHSVSTPHQEIAHLHAQLVERIKKTQIEPKDILVMAPDIAVYVPYIQAIFEGGLNYQITDMPPQTSSPSIEALFLLLDLEKRRWTASAFLELISHPLIRGKHGFTREDLEQIRKWIDTTGITWGVNGAHRTSLLKKEFNEESGTWLTGLGHLIEELALASHRPERSSRVHFSQAELLGDVSALIHSLYKDVQTLQIPKTCQDWALFFKEIVRKYLLLPEEDLPLWKLLGQFEKAATRFEETCYDFHFIYALLRESAINEMAIINKNALQAVRFCSLLPMRAIPAKMICLIGMNHDAFPRKETMRSYDMLHQTECAAPSRTDFDRYLFLEALISAREAVWISYQGRDPYDFSELPPSTVVAELASALSLKKIVATTSPPCRQKALPFSIQINKAYTLPKGHFVIDVSELSRLSRSALHHFLYFHEFKMGENRAVSDEEPFTFTSLQKSQVRRESLKKPLHAIESRIKRESGFPLGMLGTLAQMQLQETLKLFPDEKGSKIALKPFQLTINPTLDVTFIGSIEGVFQEGLCSADLCTIKGAATIWPQLLVLNAYDKSKRTVHFAASNEKRELFFESPQTHLSRFIEYYFYTRDNPFPMIADWLEPILKKDEKKLSQTEVYDAALKWQLLGRTPIDYGEIISTCYPILATLYQEMVDEWF